MSARSTCVVNFYGTFIRLPFDKCTHFSFIHLVWNILRESDNYSKLIPRTHDFARLLSKPLL